MWFTTRLVLFTAIVTGVVHTVTVSAFPYGVRGSRSTASSKPDHPNDQKGLSTREYTPLTGDSTNKDLYHQLNAAHLPPQARGEVYTHNNATVLQSRAGPPAKPLPQVSSWLGAAMGKVDSTSDPHRLDVGKGMHGKPHPNIIGKKHIPEIEDVIRAIADSGITAFTFKRGQWGIVHGVKLVHGMRLATMENSSGNMKFRFGLIPMGYNGSRMTSVLDAVFDHEPSNEEVCQGLRAALALM